MKHDNVSNPWVRLGVISLLTLTTAIVLLHKVRTGTEEVMAEAELAYSSPIKLSDNELKTRLAVIPADRALLNEISIRTVLAQRWNLNEDEIAARLAASLAVIIDSEKSTARIRMLHPNANDAATVANVAASVLRDFYDEHDRRRDKLVVSMIIQEDMVLDRAKMVEFIKRGPKPDSAEGHIDRIPPPSLEEAQADLEAARARQKEFEAEDRNIPRFSIGHIRWAKVTED